MRMFRPISSSTTSNPIRSLAAWRMEIPSRSTCSLYESTPSQLIPLVMCAHVNAHVLMFRPGCLTHKNTDTNRDIRRIFFRRDKVIFPDFFPGVKCFFPVENSNFVDPNKINISGFEKWKAKKKKKKVLFSFSNFSLFHFQFCTFSFLIFPLFCSIFPCFLASLFPVGQ